MGRRGEYKLVLSADGRVLRQEVKKAEGDLKSFEGTAHKVADALKKLGATTQQDLASPFGKLVPVLEALGPAGLAAAAGIGALVVGAAKAAGALVDLGLRGSQVANLERSFNALAGASGESATAIVEAAKRGSQGMVSNFDIMQAANKGFLLGLPITANEMETLSKASVSLGQAMNVGPQQALQDLITGLGRGSAAILDNLGITVKAEDAYKRYADSVGKSVSELTAAEQKIAIYNAAMVAAKEATATVGGVNIGFAEGLQSMKASWEDIRDELGKTIATNPALISGLKDIASAVGDISGIIQENKGVLSFFFNAIAGNAIRGAGALAGGAKHWAGEIRDAVGLIKGDEIGLPPVRTKTGFGASPTDPFGSINEAAMEEFDKLGGARFQQELAAAKKAASDAEAAARKAASDAEAAARKAAQEQEASIRAMAEAIKAAKQDMDAFWADAEKEASKFGQEMLKVQIARNEAAAGLPVEMQEVGDDVAATFLQMQQEADDAFNAMVRGLDNVSAGFMGMGDVIGGTLGKLLGFFGQSIRGIADIKVNLKAFKDAGGGFTGLLGKVGAGLGIAGAAFGIGKSIFGGIKSLFGGGKKKEEAPVKSLAEQFDEVRKASEKAGTVGSKALRSIIDQARSAKEKVPEVEAFVREQIGKATGAMGGITGTLKDGKLSGGINIASPESAKAQATIFTSTFWAAVKEQGLVSAVDALQAPFEALREKLTSGGFDVSALLGGVGGIFDALGGENSQARAALEGVDALKAALEGVADAGYLTRDSFSAFQTSAQDAFNQAVAGGLSNEQALQAIAPMLASIISASNEYGFAIDANTQALIDQAKAAGAAFPQDPIIGMRDAVRELINEIRTMNGLPVRDWGPPPPGAPGGSGDSTAGSGQPAAPAKDYTSAASGMPLQKLNRDRVVQAHQGEYMAVWPKGEPITIPASAIGTSTIGAMIPSWESSVGGTVISPNITLAVDTHGEARSKQKFLEEIEQKAYEGILSGSSKILKGLQDRGSIRK